MANRCIPRVALGALTLALLGLAWRAEAACDPDGNPSPAGSSCYVLKGSDTLFDIMTAAVNGARTGSITASGYTQTFTPVTGSTDLYYAGTGSGNAETAMKQASTTGIGVQSIGPIDWTPTPVVVAVRIAVSAFPDPVPA